MSDMKLVRDLLHQAKREHNRAEMLRLIDQAIENSYRDYVKKRVPCQSQPITRELAAQIMNDYRGNNNQSCQALANKHNVNPGRVSELISGKHEYSSLEWWDL